MQSFKKLIYPAILLLFIVSSCSSDSNVKTEEVETPAVEELETEAPSEVTYVLPSPLQIASIFKHAGLNYSAGIANPAANTAKLSNSFSKALGLGVYSADMAYFITNKQSQEAINYMKLIRDLTNDLGLSAIFSTSDLLTRFEKNISNEDSMAYILSDIQMEMDALLEEGGQDYISPIVFSGAWVESIYIGTKTYEKKKNAQLANKLGEQSLILDNLVKALKAHKDKNANIPKLLAHLTEVQDILSNFNYRENRDEENENDTMEVKISDAEITALAAKIAEVREMIINGNI